MRKFLRQNHVALVADVSFGSGKSLRDFAHLIGITEKQFARFSKVLRWNRYDFRRRMRLAIRHQKGGDKFMVWIAKIKNLPS